MRLWVGLGGGSEGWGRDVEGRKDVIGGESESGVMLCRVGMGWACTMQVRFYNGGSKMGVGGGSVG